MTPAEHTPKSAEPVADAIEDHDPDLCPYCHGSGQYDDATPCPWCDGDGTEPW